MPPEDWGASLSEARLVALTKTYLAAEGWNILPPWDWLSIHIRARRENHHLNVRPVTDRMMRWTTLIKDVREAADKVDSTVGVLTTEDVHAIDRAEALGGGSFIITPADLPNVTDILALAVAARNKAQGRSG